MNMGIQNYDSCNPCGYGCGNTSKNLFCFFYWIAIILVVIAVIYALFSCFRNDCKDDCKDSNDYMQHRWNIVWLFIAAIAFGILALIVWGGYVDSRSYGRGAMN